MMGYRDYSYKNNSAPQVLVPAHVQPEYGWSKYKASLSRPVRRELGKPYAYVVIHFSLLAHKDTAK